MELPASFGRLRSLEYLDLRANALSDLPDDLENLTNLRKIDLRSNRLARYPHCLSMLAARGCLVYT